MILLLALMACTTEEPVDTAPDETNLFEPPPEGTTWEYLVGAAGAGATYWPGVFADGAYKGEPSTEVTFGDFTEAQPEGIRAWIVVDDADASILLVRAIEVWGGRSDTPTREYRFEPPMGIHRDQLREDEDLTLAPTGEFVINGTVQDMDIQGTYALTNVNDTLDVPYGRLGGCWIYEFELVERGIKVATQLELKPRIGLVRARGLLGFNDITLAEVYEP